MDFRQMKLSPQARKAIMRNDPSAQMKAMVELAPGKTPDDLAMRTTSAGTPELLSWSPQSHLMTLLVTAENLNSLAEDTAVTYIQVGGAMRR
ncbi:hypothetical protein B0E33_15920 [Roseibium algicola]|jgi:hypothetical protein|uniref:Uncharacterized protein n=2 Tax=Hyphomicrobiales TaxID=356 RepID=A0ABM6I3G1_9HYPH|nr:hypothetical protein B0E33_15920 [Roseibium aggregatum]